jgi:ParB family transcriptional regulator, chromosome partitioning protein
MAVMANRRQLSELIRKNAATLLHEDVSIDASSSEPIEKSLAQVQQLENEISELKSHASSSAEKQNLEQHIEELTLKLTTMGGEHQVPVHLIDPDPNQPRTIFPQRLIQKRANSLQRHGQQAPVIVRPLSNGRYLMFEGAVRWMAAPLAGIDSLRAVFLPSYIPHDKGEVFEKQFTTSNDTDKLHDLDVAQSLIQIIANRHPRLEAHLSEIPSILNRAIHHLKAIGRISELSSFQVEEGEVQKRWLKGITFKEAEQEAVVEVLLDLQLNPASVNANLFPILKLPEDIKTIIRKTGIEGSKAKELAKLTATTLNLSEAEVQKRRSQVADQIVQEGLSLSQIRSLVRGALEPEPNVESTKKPTVAPQAKQTVQQIQTLNFEGMEPKQLAKIQKLLQQKLRELEGLMETRR